MIYQEIVTEIENLPLDKQLALMETLARSISRRAFKRSAPKTSVTRNIKDFAGATVLVFSPTELLSQLASPLSK